MLLILLLVLVITILLLFYFFRHKPKPDTPSKISFLRTIDCDVYKSLVLYNNTTEGPAKIAKLYNDDCSLNMLNTIAVNTPPDFYIPVPPLPKTTYKGYDSYEYFVIYPVGPIKLGFSMPDANGNFGPPEKQFTDLGLDVETIDVLTQSYPLTYYILTKQYSGEDNYLSGNIDYFNLYAYNTLTKVTQVFRDVSRIISTPGEGKSEPPNLPKYKASLGITSKRYGTLGLLLPAEEDESEDIEFPFGPLIPSKFKQDIQEVGFYPEKDTNNTFVVNGYIQTYGIDTSASYLMIGPEISGLQSTDNINVNDIEIDLNHFKELYADNKPPKGTNMFFSAYGVFMVFLPNVEIISVSSGQDIDTALVSTRIAKYNKQNLEVKILYVSTPSVISYKNTNTGKVVSTRVIWNGGDGFNLLSNLSSCTTPPDNIKFFNNKEDDTSNYYILVGQPKYICDGDPQITDSWGATCNRSDALPSYGTHPICCPKSFVEGSCYGCDPDGSHCVGDHQCNYPCDTSQGGSCNTKYGLCQGPDWEEAPTDKCCCTLGGCGGDFSTPSIGHPACNSHWCCPDVSPSDPNQNLWQYVRYTDEDKTCNDGDCFLSSTSVRGICQRKR